MKCTVTALLVVVVAASVQAWWEEGHMLTAQIAYTRLTPEVKARVDTLSQYFGEDFPKSQSFVEASVWLDDVKGMAFKIFDMWHYIDIPYNPEGLPDIPPYPADNNVVFAIDKNVYSMSKSWGREWTRALSVRMLTHFVGDVHQPLHSCELFSARFPEGDRGGNSFKIDIFGANRSLHQVWDSGIYQYDTTWPRPVSDESKAELAAEAINITTSYPPEFFGNETIQSTDYFGWANGSRAVAVEYVYGFGLIKEFEKVSQEYIDNAKAVAKQRVALGGYRLAHLLNTYLYIPNEPEPTTESFSLSSSLFYSFGTGVSATEPATVTASMTSELSQLSNCDNLDKAKNGKEQVFSAGTLAAAAAGSAVFGLIVGMLVIFLACRPASDGNYDSLVDEKQAAPYGAMGSEAT